MENRIVIDFNALDRIAKQLNTAGSDLDAAMSILSGAYPTRAGGAYLRLNGANIALRSVGGTVSASNVEQVITNYRGAIRRLGNHSRSLSSAAKQVSSGFQKTERGAGRGLSVGEKAPRAVGGENAGVLSADEQDTRSWLAKFLNNEYKASGAVLSGEKSGKGTLWGLSTAGTVSGSLLYGEAGVKSKMSWKWKDKDGNLDFKSFGLSTEAKATGALAKGSAEGNIGYLHGKAGGSLITGSASGEVKATLWDDGKFNPSLAAGGKLEGSVLKGSVEAGLGTDQFGVYGKAEGDVLHAEMEGQVGFGYIKDKHGNKGYGFAAEGSAMASIAQGKATAGVTVFGIDIDVGVKGYAGAVGVEGGASVTTGGVRAKFGGALGLGAGLDVSVDWSDAEWIGDAADAVSGFFGWW